MSWHNPPDMLHLSEGEVHVWLLSLTTALDNHERDILSADERDRAKRFRFPHLERGYVIAHGALRRLLGHYIGIEPERIQFEIGTHGKPYLLNSDIAFSLSHSGAFALIACTRGQQIGVDIEQMKPLDDMANVAEQVFSSAERQALDKLPSSQRLEGFYNCWTRKEAFIKAIGKGLAQPLDTFDVSLRPGDQSALLRLPEDLPQDSQWILSDLPAPSGYAAALVVERQHIKLRCWRYPGA